MKYVGYLILLVLFLYFVFVKPYMIFYGIEFEIKEPKISLRDKSFEVGEFLVFLPNFKGETFFLRVESFVLQRSSLRVKGITLINVSSQVVEEPTEYDLSHLIKRLNYIDFHVERAYISVNSLPNQSSLTLFVRGAHKEGSKLWSEESTVVHIINGKGSTKLEVSVEEAQVRGSTLEVLSSKVLGEGYSFELKGSWKGKRGDFEAVGVLDRIATQTFSIQPIRVKAKGWLDYKNINAKMQFQTEDFRIKEKHYGRLTGSGEYLHRWKRADLFFASFESRGVRGKLEYDLNKKILELYLPDFVFDEKLFGLEQNLRGLFSGRVLANLSEKTVRLGGEVKDLSFQDIQVKTAQLSLYLDYKQKPKGEVSFASELLTLGGRFYGRDFWGELKVKGLSYQRDKVRAKFFYDGYISYVGGMLESSGVGYLLDLYLYDRLIGRSDFNLNLRGQEVLVDGKGNGFKFYASGNLKDRDIKGNLIFTNFNFREKGVELSNLAGQVSFWILDKHVQMEGMLEGKLKQEKGQVFANLNFNVKFLEGKPEGNFKSVLRDIKYGDFEFKEALLVGKVEDSKLSLNYSLEEKLKGRGTLSLSDYTFSTAGRWEGELKGSYLALSYRLSNCSRTLCMGELVGNAKFENITIPINARFDYKEGDLRANLKGFDFQKGPIRVRVEGLRLEKGKVLLGGGSVRFNSEEVFRLLPAEGTFDLKEESFEISNIKIRGYGQGSARVFYSKSKGFSCISEGNINLEKVSALLKSRIQSLLIGNMYYYLEMNQGGVSLAIISKEPVELRSKYVGFPLKGNAYFYGDGKIFRGSMKFSDNDFFLELNAEGTDREMNIGFNTDRLPLVYRDENFKGSIILKGKGTVKTDYKKVHVSSDLKVAGTVEIRDFPKEKQARKKEDSKISLDLKVSSYEPLRVYLPEGYIYTSLEGYVKDAEYKFRLSLLGGELTYFKKKFFVRSGSLEVDNKNKNIDLTIVSSLPEYVAIIDIKGSLEYPKVFLRANPPREAKRIATDLLLGGGGSQGLISLENLLFSQVLQVGEVTKAVEKTLGTDINISVSPHLSSSGEVGVSTKISKDITERLSVEYQQSTLRNPRESYVGTDAKITSGTSVGGRINSDNSREVRLRVRGKFNF